MFTLFKVINDKKMERRNDLPDSRQMWAGER